MTDRTQMDIYFDRQPHARDKKLRSWLATVSEPEIWLPDEDSNLG